ncbi:MAG: hypothetical protein GXP16_05420 [Gammaproteobacteria bacterium]|nr:hypothetical protein [Gammaproteobacteria bacterium]
MEMIERIYQENEGLWYYRTRGNHAVGPFENKTAAEKALKKQIRSWAGRASPKPVWPRTWHPTRLFRRSATRQS